MLEKGKAVVVLGAQFGDEGKGKFVDVLSEKADLVCRVQGGNNAGHTIYVGSEKIVTHLLPIGVVRENCEVAIGSGVVIDPFVLHDEFEKISAKGINLDPRRVHLDGRAHVILPYHRLQDGKREAERSKSGEAIGTTGRGIGPAYASRAYREGLRMAELIDSDQLKAHFNQHPHLREGLTLELEEKLSFIASFMKPFVKDTAHITNSKLHHGARVLIEGAQGALLDPSFGTYPFVTSSSLVSGSCAGGIGIPPWKISQVIGVIKSYSTRVGNGPYPGELSGTLETHLRDLGKEYGATTGRPRRVGWLDLVALRYMSRVNGITSIALMKSDVLCGFDQVGIVTAYRDKRTNELMPGWPMTPRDWDNVDAVVEFYEGWPACTEGDALTRPFQRYVQRIEHAANAPVVFVSTGAERSAGLWYQN